MKATLNNTIVPARWMHLDELLESIDQLNPRQYHRTRNYLDGAVTWLSPYITHGVIDTVDVAERLLANHDRKACYKLLFELAWREYFHRLWQDVGDDIFSDLQRAQVGVESTRLPRAIHESSTGIDVLDRSIDTLQETGWMHNHARMWLAGITCNLAHTYWQQPAKWLYYHLLDGDLASNTLSWQWIAGTASHKQYIANQENLNKYSRSRQANTWLDQSYSDLAKGPTPTVLVDRIDNPTLPQTFDAQPVPDKPPESIALHSLWNLNPRWQTGGDHKHVLFIDRAQIDAWPMSKNRWAFIQHCIDQLDVEVWLDDVSALQTLSTNGPRIIRTEYPACNDWPGEVEQRRFFYQTPERAFKSFSQFWKQVQ